MEGRGKQAIWHIEAPHATIAAVGSSGKTRAGLIVGGAMLLLITLPYLLAWLLTPEGSVFPGFLVNPLDGFSYLAKMNQGQAGRWLFRLPYTPNAGQPTLLFTFYIFLGHVVRWLGLSPIFLFHGARLLAAAAMAWAAFLFFRKIDSDQKEAGWGYVIFLLGAGFGWLAAPFGWLTSDLMIPESIPLFAASLNPHFPLTYTALALAVINSLGNGLAWRRSVFNLGLGILLGAVQPFAAFALILVLAVWLIWEVARGQSRGMKWRQHPGLLPTIGLALGAVPWLIYQYWLTLSHPVLNAWNLQNQTPSPNPLAYLLGFGLPLGLAIIGLWRGDNEWNSSKRLMMVWLVVNGLLLYAPFNLQRRFSLGLFLPIAALGGWGLAWIARRFEGRRWLPYALIALMLPSNLFALAAGVGVVASGSPLLLLDREERIGYQWMADHLSDDPLVLAAPRTGNRLPAYAQVRVIYGHPFETPAAESNEALVKELLRQALGSAGHAAALREQGVEYVVIGPYERELLGSVSEIPDWPVMFSEGDFTVLAVPAP